MNAAIIFGLLIALMLTGMPISISLGLTVLTFILVLTQVPLESVALKLFTGIEKWESWRFPSSSSPATSSPTGAWRGG
jgi:C4-dicarboxylate transporter DctM subunit